MENTQAAFKYLKNPKKPQKHQVDKDKSRIYPSDDDPPPSNQSSQNTVSKVIAKMLEEVERRKKEEDKTLEKAPYPKKVEHKKTDYELSYKEFIKPDPKSSIRFTSDKFTKSCLTEQTWDPLKDLESEMLMIPEDVLNRWQKKHVEQFASEFEWHNSARQLLTLNETELKRTESQVIRGYCLSLFEKMKLYFTFLEPKFPNIVYYCCCGSLPEEIPGNPPPPLDQKVIVLTMATAHLKRIDYPAAVIVPTGYLMHPEDYKLLKTSIKNISKRWSEFDEFYGILTNFKMTILFKYNRSEKQFYQWQHALDFNECFLGGSLEKLKNFYKIWFALLFRALEVYSKTLN